MRIKNVLASVAVRNLSQSSQWYEKLFGRPADSRPMTEAADWKFEGGGWLQVYQLPESAGAGSFTLAVTSVEEAVAQLEKMGVDTGTRTASEKVKTAMIADPDGNHIAFAEAIDPSLAR